MQTVRLELDVEKLSTDLRSAQRRLAEADEAVERAEAEQVEARRDVDRIESFIREVNNYLVPPVDDGSSSEVPSDVMAVSGPLAGLSAVDAGRRFIEMNPDRQMKLSAIYDQMKRLGYEGSENSVSVAFSQLARGLEVTRLRKGIYLFSTEDADGDREGQTIRLLPQEAEAG